MKLKRKPVPVDQTVIPAGWVECPGESGTKKHRIHEIACGIRRRDGWGCTEKCPIRKKEEPKC